MEEGRYRLSYRAPFRAIPLTAQVNMRRGIGLEFNEGQEVQGPMPVAPVPVHPLRTLIPANYSNHHQDYYHAPPNQNQSQVCQATASASLVSVLTTSASRTICSEQSQSESQSQPSTSSSATVAMGPPQRSVLNLSLRETLILRRSFVWMRPRPVNPFGDRVRYLTDHINSVHPQRLQLPTPIRVHPFFAEWISRGVNWTNCSHYQIEPKSYYWPTALYWCPLENRIRGKKAKYSNAFDAEVATFNKYRRMKAKFNPAGSKRTCFKSLWFAYDKKVNEAKKRKEAEDEEKKKNKKGDNSNS